MWMVMFTKDSGLTVRQTVRESICTQTGQCTTENGNKMTNMDTESRPGLTVLSIKVNTSLGRKKVKGYLSGQIIQATRVSS